MLEILRFIAIFFMFHLILTITPPTLILISADTTLIVISLSSTNSADQVKSYTLHMALNGNYIQLPYNLTLTNNVALVSEYGNSSLISSATYTFKATVTDNNTLVSEYSAELSITTQDPVSLAKSVISYADEIFTDEEAVVTLKAFTNAEIEKTVGGDVIYMNITNGCKMEGNSCCVRLVPGDNNYTNDVLFQPIVQIMTDHNNGTYTGRYTITQKAGYVTLSFFKIRNGYLHGECFDNAYLSGNKIDTMLTSELDFDFRFGVVCGGLSDYVSARWVGKLVSPVTKTMEFLFNVDTGGRLYINSQLLIDKWDYIADPNYYTSFLLVKDNIYDITIEFNEKTDSSFIQFYWKLTDSWEIIKSQYFLYSKEFGITHDVEVICKDHYYKVLDGVCTECDFRCLKCIGDNVGDCLSCDIDKEGISNSSLPCKCDEGYAAHLPTKSCLRCTDPWCIECNSENLNICTECTSAVIGVVHTTTNTCGCSKGEYRERNCDRTELNINNCSLNKDDMCKNCPLGTYNPVVGIIGLSGCIYCPIGTYGPNTGRIQETDCESCPEGTYNDEINKESLADCKQCEINYFNPNSRKASCEKCPIGTFNLFEGSTLCNACHRMCSACYGPINNNCYECRTDIPRIIKVSETKCGCQNGYYYDDSIDISLDQYCKPCSRFCRHCNENGICLLCYNMEGYTLISGECKCDTSRYIEYFNLDPDSYECIKCHGLCESCEGPLFTQCYTCNERAGAIYSEPMTCSCPSHQYYDSSAERCEECSSLCLDCFGPSNKECYGCNYPLAYGVEGEENLCTPYCEVTGSYYFNINICKACHPDCKSCSGPKLNNCLSCLSPEKVLYNYKCVIECPSNYLVISGICQACHSSCSSCKTLSKEGCVSCHNGYRFWQGQCINKCPKGTYIDSDGINCLKCPLGCKICSSESKCTECSNLFYKTDYNCVEECPLGKYPNELLRECSECNSACASCYGPTSNECLECNSMTGYGKPNEYSRNCYQLECSDGTYLYFSNESIECLPCHHSCKTCRGGSEYDCINCNKGLAVFSLPPDNKMICSVCPTGFTINSKGKCIGIFLYKILLEICGDGLNMGQCECDDGNRNDGDGCSSNCKVEEGFKCHRVKNSPDSCVDISPPYGILTLQNKNSLLVKFNEPMKMKVNSAILASKLTVNMSIQCKLNWNLEDEFEYDAIMLKLRIYVSPKCTLRNSKVVFIVHFEDISMVVDSNDNVLSTETLRTNSIMLSYLSDELRAQTETTGTLFGISSLLTLVLMIATILFQSIAIESFWSFLNMLQVLSYLPILNLNIPSNLELFLIEYLTIKELKIPFNLLPDFPYNPTKYAELFIAESFNERFALNNYFDESTVTGLISVSAASIALFLSLVFFLKAFYLVENEEKILELFSFKVRYGTIIDDIKIDKWSIFYYPIFLFQRLLYAINVPYLIYIEPFKGNNENRITIYNEITIAATFLCTLIMNLIELPVMMVEILGWISIALVMISLIYVWFITLPRILKGFYRIIFCSKKTNRINEFKSERKIENSYVKSEPGMSREEAQIEVTMNKEPKSE